MRIGGQNSSRALGDFRARRLLTTVSAVVLAAGVLGAPTMALAVTCVTGGNTTTVTGDPAGATTGQAVVDETFTGTGPVNATTDNLAIANIGTLIPGETVN